MLFHSTTNKGKLCILALYQIYNICVLLDGRIAGSFLWIAHTDVHPLQKMVLYTRHIKPAIAYSSVVLILTSNISFRVINNSHINCRQCIVTFISS